MCFSSTCSRDQRWARPTIRKGGAGERGRSRQRHGTGNATPVPDEHWSACAGPHFGEAFVPALSRAAGGWGFARSRRIGETATRRRTCTHSAGVPGFGNGPSRQNSTRTCEPSCRMNSLAWCQVRSPSTTTPFGISVRAPGGALSRSTRSCVEWTVIRLACASPAGRPSPTNVSP